MRAGHWPRRATEAESDVERTDYVPVVDVDDPVGASYPTAPVGTYVDPAAADAAFADELLAGSHNIARPRPPASRARRRVGTILLGTGAALIALFAGYIVDLLGNLGDVPRGVVVAGVEVGGLPQAEAEAKLRRELGPRLTEPVRIRAGDVRAELDPAEAGLSLDWTATLEQAGMQSVNPISRALSFFTTREVDVVSVANMRALRAAVSELADERLNHPAIEGSIGFEPVSADPGAVQAFAIEPRHGQRLANTADAARAVAANWLGSEPIELAVDVEPVQATAAGVHALLRTVVQPMVSAPVTVRGEGAEAVLQPATIAESLSFSARGDGSLRVSVDRSMLREDVLPELAGTERAPENARFKFTGSGPSVRAGHGGRSIDWARTFGAFTEVAGRAEHRVLPVAYHAITPEVSTAELEELKITEVIGEFSVDDVPQGAAARNVATIAAKVNGAVVRPGETFRLNDYTGPRTGASSYLPVAVRAGTDELVSGGGVAPFTTALYNAAYLAGLTDAAHTPHHSYPAGYPLARDAVSLSPEGEPVPMAFTNDSPTGVLVRAGISAGRVTVTLWGTEHYRVESSTSDRSDVEPPPVEHSGAADCEPRDGAPGFTVSNTRVVYDAESGEELRRNTTTVTYAPRPRVVCNSA